MKKAVLLTLCLILVTAITALAMGEIGALTASIDDKDTVTITGQLVEGAGKQVTVRVTDPTGNIDYINQTTTDSEGNFTFVYKLTNAIEGTYQVIIGGEGITTPHETDFYYQPPDIGDVNGDDKIDVVDAILVLRHIVGLINLETEYGPGALVRAKMSGGIGEPNVGDAILILRHIVGLN